MNPRFAPVFVASLCLAAIARPAVGCQACVEEQLLNADVVVEGAAGPLAEAPGGERRPPGPRTARLPVEVREVLKGPPELKRLEVECFVPPPAGEEEAASPLARALVPLAPGTTGIFVLREGAQPGVYASLVPREAGVLLTRDAVTNALASQARLAGGPVTNGLQLIVAVQPEGHAETPWIPGGPGGNTYTVPAAGAYKLALIARNVTAAPIVVCSYAADMPAELEITDPDGGVSRLAGEALYPGVRFTAALPPPRAHHFLRIPPGGMRRLHNIPSGRLEDLPALRVRAVFTAARDGREAGYDGAWTGRMTSAPVFIRRAPR